MNCEYCGATLKTLSSLKLHQKTAKYCLSQQNITTIEEHSCGSCSKKFNRKSCLDNHLKICKENSFEKELRVKYENREKELISLYEKDRIIQEKDRIIQEKDRIIQEQKLISEEQKLVIEEQKLVIKEFQDDQRKQNKDLTDRIQCIAEKAIERPWETVVEIEQETDNIEEISNEPYELVPLELDNGYIIESREKDGYINITNLCKAGGKEFKHWNSLGKTKAFLKALSTAVGIPTAILIQLGTGSKFGTTEENTGTWVHPQVAINIAQWISPQFDVKVSAWVFEVMITGKIDITNTKSYRELQQDNKNKQLKIQLMTKKYVKKQPRTQYDERNVVYILTTANMKKERRYILGKATNLTSRLSVYNKSDEHEVIYYQECLNEEKMGVVETLVFCKLNDYREQANRERFFLPEGEKLDLFIDTIKECIKFVK
jgi:hypothetical protein